MSSGCGDVLSLADLQTAKKHQVFEAEVITGKSGGVAGGADIDYATNQVTGQTQKTLPAVLRDAGFQPASFTFDSGGTLGADDANKAVLWPSPGGDGNFYAWKGALPKTIPASSTPASTGGIGPTAWVAVSEAALRTELASPTGYQLIPSMPGYIATQQWKLIGDIRGWGAVCDGVTDDINAITQAIADTGGRIVIPKDTFVSTHILFNGLTDVCVSMLNGAKVKIDTTFVFNPSYRGIFEFVACHNVTTRDLNILGAKLDKLNAPEPWQDGDAGIEYSNCSGILHAINPKVKDVKTWGIIHVACTNADSIIDNADIENCQVQSGIGGTGYKSLTINGGRFYDIGLYGVELETRDRNVRTKILGAEATLCNKGFAAVNNSDNILVANSRAINCLVGFNFYSDDLTDEAFRGDNLRLKSCVATSCQSSFAFIYPRDLSMQGCSEDVDNIDYFVRKRALDRVIKIASGKAYVSLDSATETLGWTVGEVLQMDDGMQFTVATVDDTATVDSVYGHIVGFTTTPALDPKYLRSSIRRYVQISTGKVSLILYGGKNVIIKSNDFSWSESVFVSYGNHEYLQWSDNTTYSCQHYFAQGSTGTVTGSVRVESGQNQNLGDWGSPGKFSSAIKSGISLRFDNEANHASTIKPRYITVEDTTLLARVRVVVDAGSVTTGTAVLKLNGTDAVILAGSPLVGEASLSPLITTAGNINIQLTDTAGDIVATGYSIKIYHLAK